MTRYIVPKIFCIFGTLIIFAGIFFSVMNIRLGNYSISLSVAICITVALLALVILAYNMKKTDNMRKLRLFLAIEVISLFLFAVSGLASLLIFNHCFTVWQSAEEIKEKMNIRQLESMLPEYEKYAHQRIEKYNTQLSEAIKYRQYRQSDLSALSLDVKSSEDLNSQKDRKMQKLEQIVFPYFYDSLKVSINDSIKLFVRVVENLSPLTMSKNITRIEEWAKSWEFQLIALSHYKMNGENADDFRFNSTFGNVKNILTVFDDFFERKRNLGYGIGFIALILMLFPYIKVRRSNKFNY